MDLGCLDMGCIDVSEKHSNDAVLDSQNKESHSPESLSSASKPGKSKLLKDSGPSTLNALNKFTSQIKKPPHRKNSPLNWFPRRKVESYLKRKIKMLQEVDGMNLTLDETLGDSNPHYSRVLREKMAAREAAHKAMEARKAALVEASWCRILRAARIQSKEAEAQLLKAEKAAAEAFEAAAAIGVIMYDIPNCPQKPCEIETSSVNEGESTTHTVKASFETAFEVDKEVAAAVKTAFTRLENCSSFNKDELKDILRKIRETPDADDYHDLSEVSECESELGTEHKTFSEKDAVGPQQDLDNKTSVIDTKNRKSRRRQSFGKLNVAKLVDMMLERLRRLHEDELSSLATIVATCGLNATLAEVENSKLQNPSSNASTINIPRRMSSMGAGTMRNSSFEPFMDGLVRKKQAELEEFPSLDKYLVKHMTKLEKEVLEARNAQKNLPNEEIKEEGSNEANDGMGSLGSNTNPMESVPDLGRILVKHSSKFEREIEEAKKNAKSFGTAHKNPKRELAASETIPDLGSILVKHSSKLEKEIEETKRNYGNAYEMNDRRKEKGVVIHPDLPSLDKVLVKHMSRLEKEVMEARNRSKNDNILEGNNTSTSKKTAFSSTLGSEEQKDVNFCSGSGKLEKENIDSNKEVDRNSETEGKELKMNPKEVTIDSLEKILVKPMHRLEKEKIQASKLGIKYEKSRMQRRENDVTDYESLDKVLVKHMSRLEKEKMRFNAPEEEVIKVKKPSTKSQINEEGSLDQILVKHKPRLEREKTAAMAAEQGEDQTRISVCRKEARERELQEAWGGLSLGNSLKPHLSNMKSQRSRLEREKTAAMAAEQGEDQTKISVCRQEARERELQEAWGGLSLGNSMKPHLSNIKSQVNEEGSLDQILVKHKPRLEREKTAAMAAEQGGDQTRISVCRKEARERELQEAWGGLSLGNSMKRHLSKLQRDKAAWIKAEEEERRQATNM